MCHGPVLRSPLFNPGNEAEIAVNTNSSASVKPALMLPPESSMMMPAIDEARVAAVRSVTDRKIQPPSPARLDRLNADSAAASASMLLPSETTTQ